MNVDSRGLISINNYHVFKVFRKTTLFRKYSKGISKFVRRKNIARKRVTNATVLVSITKN